MKTKIKLEKNNKIIFNNYKKISKIKTFLMVILAFFFGLFEKNILKKSKPTHNIKQNIISKKTKKKK